MQQTLEAQPTIQILHVLMGVGKKFYKVWEDFVKEAKKTGCCKRIPGGIPQDLKIGGTNASKVLLMHNMNRADKRMLDLWRKLRRLLKREWKKEEDFEERLEEILPPEPVFPMRIFAYFTIRGIMIVADEEQLAELVDKEGVKIQKVSEESATSFSERGCGTLAVGASYFVSEEDMEKLQKHADMGQGHITLLYPPIITSQTHFRGFKYIRGERVLNGDPEETWFEGIEEIRKQNNELRRVLAGKRRRKPKPKLPEKGTQLEMSQV